MTLRDVRCPSHRRESHMQMCCQCTPTKFRGWVAQGFNGTFQPTPLKICDWVTAPIHMRCSPLVGIEEDFRHKTNSLVKAFNCVVIVIQTRDYTSKNMGVRNLGHSLGFVVDLDSFVI